MGVEGWGRGMNGDGGMGERNEWGWGGGGEE